MPQRLSLKPDSSFFRKIAVGAIGALQVVSHLNELGHDVRELERGSTGTKLWKDVKRKRVRIPDLVCVKCGQRIECRAKSKFELAMSHSRTDAERSWDYGLVNQDWIAFPVCLSTADVSRTVGRLSGLDSYWRERNWIAWQTVPYLNYFTVGEFRRRLHAKSSTKSGIEGAETFISWAAVFSTVSGTVEYVDHDAGRVKVRPTGGGRLRSWRIAEDAEAVVSQGDQIEKGQVIISALRPIRPEATGCSGQLGQQGLAALLESHERTQRFTGVKLARLLGIADFERSIYTLVHDEEEDIYVRLEAASYLSSVGQHDASTFFQPFLSDGDEQTQLETVIALGECGSQESIDLLCQLLRSNESPFFLRSAAAWSLAQTSNRKASQHLVAAFADVREVLRREAMECLVQMGSAANQALVQGLVDADANIAAGCAEVLRQQQEQNAASLPLELKTLLHNQPNAIWPVWLAGNVPTMEMKSAIASLQESQPQLHFAVTILWSFLESWIALDWDPFPNPRRTVESFT